MVQKKVPEHPFHSNFSLQISVHATENIKLQKNPVSVFLKITRQQLAGDCIHHTVE